jgi:hypothetical protein
MNKGQKLIIKNAIDYVEGRNDGRLTYGKKTEKEKIKGKCPGCGEETLYRIYGLGGMGVGQDVKCKCGYSELSATVNLSKIII